MIAFAFGFFHGLGFASLVAALDVSRSTQLVSLVGRNVGIEIGQAMVIFMTFPALFLLRRTRLYRQVFVRLVMALALMALLWAVERVFEVDLRVSEWVDKLVKFPRSLGFAVVATVVAAALYWWERRANRLLPTHGKGDDMVIDLTDTKPQPVLSP